MANLNPNLLMQTLKNGNPRQVAMSIIQQKYPNDPQMYQLIQMAERGDTQQLQKIAEQMLGQQGKSFTAEMNNLVQTLQLF